MSEIIMLIVSIIGLLCSLAFLAYKLGIFECDSWEEAVKELLRYLKTGTVNGYYFLTDTVPPEKQVNRWILLSDAETVSYTHLNFGRLMCPWLTAI